MDNKRYKETLRKAKENYQKSKRKSAVAKSRGIQSLDKKSSKNASNKNKGMSKFKERVENVRKIERAKNVLKRGVQMRQAIKEKKTLSNKRKSGCFKKTAPMSLLWLYQWAALKGPITWKRLHNFDTKTYKEKTLPFDESNYRPTLNWTDVIKFVDEEGKDPKNKVWAVVESLVYEYRLQDVHGMIVDALKNETKMFNKGYTVLYHAKNSTIYIIELVFKYITKLGLERLKREKETILNSPHVKENMAIFKQKQQKYRNEINQFQVRLINGFYPVCIRTSGEPVSARQRAKMIGVDNVPDNHINRINEPRLISCSYSLFSNWPDGAESSLAYVVSNNSQLEGLVNLCSKIPMLYGDDLEWVKVLVTNIIEKVTGVRDFGTLNQISIPCDMVDELVYDSGTFGTTTDVKNIEDLFNYAFNSEKWDEEKWQRIHTAQARIVDLCYEQTTHKGVNIKTFTNLIPQESAVIKDAISQFRPSW